MGDTVSSLLFQPPPPTKLKEHKIIWLDTDNGSRIPAFYISYKHGITGDSSRSLTHEELLKSRPDEGITLLYSHANAEDLGSIYPWCKFLSKTLGVSLLAYDYTGYGMAFGVESPSEDHCYSDIDAAYRFLRQKLNVPAANIVLYGRSLGSGPSCHLAAGTASPEREPDGPVGGVILHAPFLSVYRIVVDPGCTVYGDKFPNVDLAPMFNSPTTLVHGTSDHIVPFSHSERLFKTIPTHCRTSPLFVEGMGHNNVHSSVRPMFVKHLGNFLDEYVWPEVKNRRNDRARRKRAADSPTLQVRLRSAGGDAELPELVAITP